MIQDFVLFCISFRIYFIGRLWERYVYIALSLIQCRIGYRSRFSLLFNIPHIFLLKPSHIHSNSNIHCHLPLFSLFFPLIYLVFCEISPRPLPSTQPYHLARKPHLQFKMIQGGEHEWRDASRRADCFWNDATTSVPARDHPKGVCAVLAFGGLTISFLPTRSCLGRKPWPHDEESSSPNLAPQKEESFYMQEKVRVSCWNWNLGKTRHILNKASFR